VSPLWWVWGAAALVESYLVVWLVNDIRRNR
jgi:hypothetical protein